jgi:glycosyltransferase involved in cell wall biosynthesis
VSPPARDEAPSIAVVSAPFDADIRDPADLLVRYRSLGCWVRALVEAGAGPVTVIQRFHRDAHVQRDGAHYQFVCDGGPAKPRAWAWSHRVAGAVRAAAPAVVHVDGLVFPLLIRHLRLSLPGDTAIVVQDHGGVHAGSAGFQSWQWRLFYRLGLRAADGFLFTDRGLAAPWLASQIMRPDQAIYEVLESSTDMAATYAPDDDGGPPMPGSPALLWVGRLDENKDPLTILHGFERVAAAHPRAMLTMVFGTDGLLPRVTARIAASPVLAGRVRLLGKIDHQELPRLYAAADFFVLGSHHEAAGFALLEALSFGVTPVVSDIPPFRMLTDGGRLGALFPIGDGEAMGAALLRLCSGDPTARRELVRGHFGRALSWPVVGRSLLAAYRDVSARRRQRRQRRPAAS